jgi:Protein of unknown function (DUF2937)
MLSGGVPPWSGSGRASAIQDDSVECPRGIMLLMLAFMVIAATRLRATSRNGSEERRGSVSLDRPIGHFVRPARSRLRRFAMGFFSRWFSSSITMAFALASAILAMQAPAFTREYASALLQVAQDSRRDVEQRKASARQFYSITAEDDARFIQALKAFEPSNAETLALSLERTEVLRSAYERIANSPLLMKPIAAAWDAFDDGRSYKAAVWHTLLDTYDVQVNFGRASAAYALVGLLLGSLVAQLLLSSGRGIVALATGRRRLTRHGVAPHSRSGS